MNELIISLKLNFLKMFLNPHGEKYFFRYKRIVEKSLFYRQASRSIDTINLRDKLSDLILKESKFQNSPVFVTQEKIKFGSINFGTTMKSFQKIADKPNFVAFERFENNVFVAHKYQEQFSGRMIKRNFLFCNDEFFFGEFILPLDPYVNPFRQFNLIDKDMKHNLISDLFSIYKISEKIESFESFFIYDKNESMLFFLDNGFTYQIKYFSRKNLEIFRTLLNYFESDHTEKITVNTLIRSILSGENQSLEPIGIQGLTA